MNDHITRTEFEVLQALLLEVTTRLVAVEKRLEALEKRHEGLET